MVIIKSPLQKFSLEEIQEVLENRSNPNVFTFLSGDNPVTIPIWTLYHNQKFYIFANKTSQKVKSIEMGNTKVALNIISNDNYPHPSTDVLSYIGIKGDARIVKFEDNDEVADIHIELLKKYDPKGEYEWISHLIKKLENEPKKAWLIEINPTKWFSY